MTGMTCDVLCRYNYHTPTEHYGSLPSLANSLFTKSSAVRISVLPYTTLLLAAPGTAPPSPLPPPAVPTTPPVPPPLVRATHSCRFPYSSMLPPPTVNTIASLNPCLLCPKLASIPCLTCPLAPPCPEPAPAAAALAVAGGIEPRAFALLGSKYK